MPEISFENMTIRIDIMLVTELAILTLVCYIIKSFINNKLCHIFRETLVYSFCKTSKSTINFAETEQKLNKYWFSLYFFCLHSVNGDGWSGTGPKHIATMWYWTRHEGWSCLYGALVSRECRQTTLQVSDLTFSSHFFILQIEIN